MAARITEYMRDHAYLASVELAKQRGPFPMFNKDLYLSGTNFASRLPDAIKQAIRKHGMRNSHLLRANPRRSGNFMATSCVFTIRTRCRTRRQNRLDSTNSSPPRAL
jgi:ribonucleotide reductase alpha subunit